MGGLDEPVLDEGAADNDAQDEEPGANAAGE